MYFAIIGNTGIGLIITSIFIHTESISLMLSNIGECWINVRDTFIQCKLLKQHSVHIKIHIIHLFDGMWKIILRFLRIISWCALDYRATCLKISFQNLLPGSGIALLTWCALLTTCRLFIWQALQIVILPLYYYGITIKPAWRSCYTNYTVWEENDLSIPKLQWLHPWTLRMDKLWHLIFHWVCDYLSIP